MYRNDRIVFASTFFFSVILAGYFADSFSIQGEMMVFTAFRSSAKICTPSGVTPGGEHSLMMINLLIFCFLVKFD